MVLPEVMIIGVGLGICTPMCTHRRMSMGRVGYHMEGASISQLGVHGTGGWQRELYISDN